jgi:hypothetical protein
MQAARLWREMLALLNKAATDSRHAALTLTDTETHLLERAVVLEVKLQNAIHESRKAIWKKVVDDMQVQWLSRWLNSTAGSVPAQSILFIDLNLHNTNSCHRNFLSFFAVNTASARWQYGRQDTANYLQHLTWDSK